MVQLSQAVLSCRLHHPPHGIFEIIEIALKRIIEISMVETVITSFLHELRLFGWGGGKKRPDTQHNGNHYNDSEHNNKDVTISITKVNLILGITLLCAVHAECHILCCYAECH
jgi:hypothetical protein